MALFDYKIMTENQQSMVHQRIGFHKFFIEYYSQEIKKELARGENCSFVEITSMTQTIMIFKHSLLELEMFFDVEAVPTPKEYRLGTRKKFVLDN
jgi:hypothetical protein